MRSHHPSYNPRAYLAAFAALLATAIAFPDGFLLVALLGGVAAVVATVALAAVGRFRR